MRSVGLIEDGSILIVDGVISNVGPTRRVENLADARAAEEINASGRVVMPGFVDSHTHVLGAPARVLAQKQRSAGAGGPPDARLAAVQYVRGTPAATLDFHARRYVELFLKHGTTTIETKSGYGLNAAAETKMLKVMAGLDSRLLNVASTFFGAHFVPPEFDDPGKYLGYLMADVMPRLRSRKLAQYVDIACGPAGFSVELSRTYLQAALRLGMGVKIHADQIIRNGGTSLGVQLAAVSVDGLNCIEAEDVDLLARSSTIATLLPGTVYQGEFDRFPPARRLVDNGAAVALATAFSPSCGSTFNMQMVVSLACTHLKLTEEEAISAATINGAYATGKGARCGSIEFNKDADLLILDVSDYREIPMHFGCNIVALVMRKGQVVYREGALTCGGG